MKVYNLIVGGEVHSTNYNGEPCSDLYIRYHPDSSPDMYPYKGAGLFNSAKLFKTTYGYEEGGYVYEFTYDKLIEYLRMHLDAYTFDDAELMFVPYNDFHDSFRKEYIGKESFRLYKKKNPKKDEFPYDKGISSIAKESRSMDVRTTDVDSLDNMIVCLTLGYDKVPLWILGMDITIEYVEREYHNGEKFTQQIIIPNKVLDETPVAMMLHLIMQKLDEDEEEDQKSLSEELNRLKSIADCYDREEEL